MNKLTGLGHLRTAAEKLRELISQVAAAAASAIEALDRNKQDKLTGTPGQVVGFDTSGKAVPQAAPNTGVTTFNGRTGAVTPQAGDYTAAQVGARPSTWMPTAAEVGARPSTWTPTAADVGARPSTWTPTAANVGAVPTTRKVNGKALSADVTLGAADVGASPSGHTHSKSEITDFPTSMPASDVPAWAKAANKPTYTAAEVGARPSNWTPTAANVGAVPTTRKVNGKALSSDISLTASDVGALPSTWTPTAAELGATRIAVGTYTGDGSAYRRINVGFRPKAVFVFRTDYIQFSAASNSYTQWGGLVVQGMTDSLVELRDDGFDARYNGNVSSSHYYVSNGNNYRYCYIAFQ